MIDTAIVIVNWNGYRYLKDCFDSLRSQTYKNFRIIFVDNGSSDNSVEFVRKNYPGTEIIELEKNTGFCFGYNTGMEKALEDENIKFVIVLNNDTKLDEKYIEELAGCAEKHADAGSVQPKIVNFFEPEKIDCAGIYIARDGTARNRGYGRDEKEYNQEMKIFGANGTASLFTREALLKTRYQKGEYFDNSHFAFYEDVDLAWRIKSAGFASYYCPHALVHHVHSGTAGKASIMKAYYLHRNYFFTVIKNYPAGRLLKTLFWRFLGYGQLVLNIFRKKKRESEFTKGYGKSQVALTIFKAWGSVIWNIPSLIRKRWKVARLEKVLFLLFLVQILVFPNSARALDVVFLSDIHADGKKKIEKREGNTIYPAKFRYCLNKVKKWKPDLVIVSGDLTEDGEKKYYNQLRRMTRGMDALWTKGNHDNEYFNLLSKNDYFVDRENWRFIVLNSSEKNSSSTGHLDDSQIARLKKWLDTDKNVAISMHHPPFWYNSREGKYSDSKEKLYNDFFNALAPNVRYVFTGHWHHEMKIQIGGVTYLTPEALTQNNECNFINLEL